MAYWSTFEVRLGDTAIVVKTKCINMESPEASGTDTDTNKTCIKKRNRITLKQKKEICEYKRKHPDAYAREIFLHFRNKWTNVVAPSTISKILTSGEKWLNQFEEHNNRKTCTRIYQPRNIPLEEALYQWYLTTNQGMNISNEMLKQKAKSLAKELNMRNFCCSNNWVYSFKKRHNLLKYTHKSNTGTSFLNIDLDYPYDLKETVSGGSKVSYLEDKSGNGTIYVTAPVTADEARQGLVSAMGYLAAQSHISRDNIDLLWNVFQQIANKPSSGSNLIEFAESSVLNADTLDQRSLENSESITDVSRISLHSERKNSVVMNNLNIQNVNESTEHIDSETDANVSEGGQVPQIKLVTDLNAIKNTEGIQLAVQGTNGEYFYVVTDLNKHNEMNLNDSLPQILQAAGHSLEDGAQFVETVDEQSGLRTITKYCPDSGDNMLIQVLLNPDEVSNNLEQNTASDTTVYAGEDHTYMVSGTECISDANLEEAPTQKLDSDHQNLLDNTVNSLIDNGKYCCENHASTDVLPHHNSHQDLELQPAEETSKPVIGSLISITTTPQMEQEAKMSFTDTAVTMAATATTLTFVKPCSVEVSHLPKFILSTKEAEHELNPVFVCSHCDKVFKTRQHLKLHKSKHGDKQVTEQTKSGVTKSGYPCQICGKTFSRQSSYKWHMGYHKNECTCVTCESGKKAKRTTKQFDKKAHELSSNCEKTAKSSSKVMPEADDGVVSNDKVNDAKPYLCSVCGSCFLEFAALCAHEKLHSHKMEWKCPTCGRCFERCADLKRHSRVHLLPAELRCVTCGKEFVNRSNLYKHRRLHTGKQDYKCSFCGKCFLDSSSLKEHRKMHTKFRHHQCTVCGQTFVLQRNLTVHMLMHHELEATRKNCSVACSSTDSTLRHQAAQHSTNKKHEPSQRKMADVNSHHCSICGKSFMQAHQLKHHKRLTHRNAKVNA